MTEVHAKDLVCPECGNSAKFTDRSFAVDGQPYQVASCTGCVRDWPVPVHAVTATVEPSRAPAPVSAPATPATPAPAPVTEPGGQLVKVGEGFELAQLAPGDELLVEYKGEPRRISVNDVTEKTVVAEIDGKPDIRVKHKQIVGRFE